MRKGDRPLWAAGPTSQKERKEGKQPLTAPPPWLLPCTPCSSQVPSPTLPANFAEVGGIAYGFKEQDGAGPSPSPSPFVSAFSTLTEKERLFHSSAPSRQVPNLGGGVKKAPTHKTKTCSFQKGTKAPFPPTPKSRTMIRKIFQT